MISTIIGTKPKSILYSCPGNHPRNVLSLYDKVRSSFGSGLE